MTVGTQVILLQTAHCLIDKLLLGTNTILGIKYTKFVQNNLVKTFSGSSGKTNKQTHTKKKGKHKHNYLYICQTEVLKKKKPKPPQTFYSREYSKKREGLKCKN